MSQIQNKAALWLMDRRDMTDKNYVQSQSLKPAVNGEREKMCEGKKYIVSFRYLLLIRLGLKCPML